jgi:hypothetical protein
MSTSNRAGSESMWRSVVVDEDAWTRAGDELRKVDPARYLAILKIVEDIVGIHRDPIGYRRVRGLMSFPKPRNDETDLD